MDSPTAGAGRGRRTKPIRGAARSERDKRRLKDPFWVLQYPPAPLEALLKATNAGDPSAKIGESSLPSPRCPSASACRGFESKRSLRFISALLCVSEATFHQHAKMPYPASTCPTTSDRVDVVRVTRSKQAEHLQRPPNVGQRASAQLRPLKDERVVPPATAPDAAEQRVCQDGGVESSAASGVTCQSKLEPEPEPEPEHNL